MPTSDKQIQSRPLGELITESLIPVLFDFDQDNLTPVQIPIKYQGASYYLLEPDSVAGAAYASAVAKAARFDGEGKFSGVDGVGFAALVLLSHCIAYANTANDGPEYVGTGDNRRPKFVPQEKLRNWLNKVTKPLFATAKKLGGIDEPETEDDFIKRINEDTKKLNELRRKKETSVLGNGSQSTETTSSSPMS